MRWGFGAFSKASEEIMIARDIILSERTGIPIHLCHVSTALGVELVRQAKKRCCGDGQKPALITSPYRERLRRL